MPFFGFEREDRFFRDDFRRRRFFPFEIEFFPIEFEFFPIKFEREGRRRFEFEREGRRGFEFERGRRRRFY